MKLWSRGLGTTEITMDFREYEVVKDPENGNIVIIGTMKDPVNWEFKITMEPDDIPGFMKILFNLGVLRMGINNAHKYLGYLKNRKQFNDKDGHRLEDKVNSAYDTMMRRNRARDRKPASRAA
ncbi:MAG: hypothetical protein AB1921_14820 [Thermodesulfobacteriota bacterium]